MRIPLVYGRKADAELEHNAAANYVLLKEGAPGMESENESSYEKGVLARKAELFPGVCISRSWELFKAQFSQVFVATLLVTVASWGVGAVPYFGIFLSGAIHGVLYGGLYAFFLKLIRGQKADLGDAFSGFSPAFPQLLLAGGITSLLTLLVAGVLALPFLIAVIPSVILMLKHSESAWPVLPGLLAVVGLCAGAAAGLALSTLWVFTVPLVMDRKMEFWPAMELSRKVVMGIFWRVLGLVISAGIIVVSGVLLCGVGLLFTLPIGFGAIAYGYETLFGQQEESLSAHGF